MSKYIKLLIFILILAIISAAILFIDSSTDNMNKLMPEISEGIVKGDKDYNDAVELVNNKNYKESMNKAVSAGKNYNTSLNKLHILQNNFSSDVNQVHKNYINTVINGMGERAGNADLISCLLAILKSSGLKGKYQMNLIKKSLIF